jgi:hypothetical protein
MKLLSKACLLTLAWAALAFGGDTNRPSVLIAGYGTPPEAFRVLFLELGNALTTYGVPLVNQAASGTLAGDDSALLQNALDVAQRQGAESVLYVTIHIDHSGGLPVATAQVQCFDAKRKSLRWEEKASSSRTTHNILNWQPSGSQEWKNQRDVQQRQHEMDIAKQKALQQSLAEGDEKAVLAVADKLKGRLKHRFATPAK